MEETRIIELNAANLEAEHIGCAISQTGKARRCADAKKAWMRANFEEGYKFWRLDAKGKALIEATPAQNAWCPIEADNWLFIDCFWVSGKFKGQGVATRLLQTAQAHAKTEGLHGLVALSSEKKRGFISDGAYYRHKGFAVADAAPPDYQLLALPFNDKAPLPRFKAQVKQPPPQSKGFLLYYSDHCPHTGKYVAVLREIAEKQGQPFETVKLQSAAEAQAAPNPFTTWALYYNGGFVTNEIYSEKGLLKFLNTVGK